MADLGALAGGRRLVPPSGNVLAPYSVQGFRSERLHTGMKEDAFATCGFVGVGDPSDARGQSLWAPWKRGTPPACMHLIGCTH